MKQFFVEKVNFNTHSAQAAKQRVTGEFLNGFEFIEPSTQKARGIMLLHKKANQVTFDLGWKVPKHLPFMSGTTFEDSSFNYPVFGRPCPTVPRHGFVDSIVCKNSEELNALSLQTHEVEENAEILVTKPVDCSYNAICTGGVITIGGGNDGATSGKNCRYFYLNEDPVGKSIEIESNQDVLIEGEVPFYEIVISKTGEVNLVQVRSAPGMPASKNYIPKAITVKNIVKAEGDLLEWETKVKSIDPETTVIDHSGGSLASHFSIHAIINGVAIFTQDCPSVGDTIEPNSEGGEITDEERAKFVESFKIGFASTPELIKRYNFFSLAGKRPASQSDQAYYFMTNALDVALATLHNYAALQQHRDFEMLGGILGVFARTCIAVSSGETRFRRTSAPSHQNDPELYNWLSSCPSSRHAVYTKIMHTPTSTALDSIIPIYKSFKNVNWGGGGYGGPKWVNCTTSAINLFNDCLNGNIEGAVEKFNVVIHTCHNGGLYLNKIQDGNCFDWAAADASGFALKNLHKISDMLSLLADIRADKSLWENDLDLFEVIDIAEINGKKAKNTAASLKGAAMPDSLSGKQVTKMASSYMIKMCTCCNAPSAIEATINGVEYVAENWTADNRPSYKSIENRDKAFMEAVAVGVEVPVQLKKIPYWLATKSGIELISVTKVNALLFNKK